MKKFRGLGFLIAIAVLALATVVIMLLWNSVATYLFNVPEINFWYSAGLIIMCKLLFGGVHKGFHGLRGHHHCCGDDHGQHGRCRNGSGKRGKFDRGMDMFEEMHERFHAMSDDERREHIRKHMAHGFGFDRNEKAGKDATIEDTAEGQNRTDE